MVAINKILLPERNGEGCGGGTRNPPREARLYACSPVHFLLSPFCRRGRPARNHRPTQPLVDNLYQGMTLDAVTGLYDERNRDYSPSLGRWMEQDPAQFINGANTYQFVNSSPVGNVDAEGEAGFTLAYQTTWVPRRRHEGAFHGWYIQWLIRPQNKIIFPASLHEFVIQHMEITVSVFDAKTGLPIHSRNGHISYWEAWHAVPGARVPRWHSKGGTNDIWRWRTREGRHTKGRITFVGTAAFYTGVTLKGWAKKNPRTLAGDLLSTAQNPHFQADSNIITRRLVVTWNWCKDRGLDKISYTK